MDSPLKSIYLAQWSLPSLLDILLNNRVLGEMLMIVMNLLLNRKWITEVPIHPSTEKALICEVKLCRESLVESGFKL